MLRMFLSFSSHLSLSLLLPFPIPDQVVLSDLMEEIASGPRCMSIFLSNIHARYISSLDILYLSCTHLLIIGMLRNRDNWLVYSVLEENQYTCPVMIRRIVIDPEEVTQDDKDVDHSLWRILKGLKLSDFT